MPTIHQYAERLARGGTPAWRAALLRVAELRSGKYWFDGEGASPTQEVPFRAGALLLFGLASQRDVPAADIGVSDIGAWLDARPQERWISDLAAILADAGFVLPPQRMRGGRGTGDRVVDTWTDMTYLFNPEAPWWDGSDGPWPDPLLPAGLLDWQPVQLTTTRSPGHDRGPA